jgi:hypothetical protein
MFRLCLYYSLSWCSTCVTVSWPRRRALPSPPLHRLPPIARLLLSRRNPPSSRSRASSYQVRLSNGNVERMPVTSPSGRSGIVQHHILNNRRHVLTKVRRFFYCLCGVRCSLLRTLLAMCSYGMSPRYAHCSLSLSRSLARSSEKIPTASRER